MGIAEMLRSIGRVESYELLAYHKLGESKYHALGRTYPVAEGTEPPSLERMRELVAQGQQRTRRERENLLLCRISTPHALRTSPFCRFDGTRRGGRH